MLVSTAIGLPSTRMLGIVPPSIVAQAQVGLYPYTGGEVGLPCGVTNEPATATGLPIANTVRAVVGPGIIVPGGVNARFLKTPPVGSVKSPATATINPGMLNNDSV